MGCKNDKPEVVWDRFWNQTANKIDEWDDLSELIYQTLLHENILEYVTSWEDKKVLEVGCGTGRISLRLSKEKNSKVYLLDSSSNALNIAKNLSKKIEADENKVFFVNDSAFTLPFQNNFFDAVMSFGLLEHFTEDEQEKLMNEFKRVCKYEGIVINMVPNKKAIIYNILRIMGMKLKTWKYGREEPLTSEDLKKLGHDNIFGIGFYYQFNFFYLLPHIGPIINIITRYLFKKFINYYDIGRYNGGYLLVGINKKRCVK